MSLTVEEALTLIEAIDASDQQNALAQEQLILELRGQYIKLEGGYQAPVHNRFPTLSYRATEFIAL